MVAGSLFSSSSGDTLPHPVAFYDVYGGAQIRNVLGHQAKFTVTLGIVLKRD